MVRSLKGIQENRKTIERFAVEIVTIFNMEVISSMAKFMPHDYQNVAKKFALERESAGLFLDMGLRQDSYNTNSYRRIKE